MEDTESGRLGENTSKVSIMVFKIGIKQYDIVKPNQEVIRLDEKKQEDLQRKKENERFRNITQKNKAENQNQTHNVRKEGIFPIDQKK